MPVIDPLRRRIMAYENEDYCHHFQLPEELQRRLIVAMINGDERKFRDCLTNYIVPQTFCAHHCIATACWRDRYANFVEILLDFGLDQNAELPNSAILETFPVWLEVYESNTKVNIEDDVSKCRGRTAVHLAAGAGNAQVLRQLLSKSDTNCNAKDSQEETPLHYATSARYHSAGSGHEGYGECVSLILQRKDIEVNCFNICGLAAVHLAALRGNICALRALLSDNRTDVALKGAHDRTLLHLLSQYQDIPDRSKDYIEACLILLLHQSVTDVNATDLDGNTALHLAAKSANILILKILAKQRTADMLRLNDIGRNLLHCVAESTVKDTERITACMEFLLNWQDNKTYDKQDTNQRDVWGYTPLHLALLEKNQTAALLLMKRGACLCERSNDGRKMLDDIAPGTLEAFFDSCLEQSGEPYEKSYKITFRYKFLPPRIHSKSSTCSGGEMGVINCISKQKHLSHLLIHPLIRSFLHLKYRRWRMIIYFNVVMYVLFVVFVNVYVSIEASHWDERQFKGISTPSDVVSDTEYILAVGVMFLTAFQFLREIIQFSVLRWDYLNSENVLDVLTLVLATVIVWNPNITTVLERNAAVVVVFLSWVELILLTGRLPIWSVQYAMLKTTMDTLLTYFVWYLIILAGFGMCFRLLFIVDMLGNRFSHPWVAVLRTIVMMTGEFDFTYLPFANFPVLSDFVFLSFVVIVFFAMLNLLNGLAVSDTQMVRDKALQLSVLSRVNIVSFMDEASAKRPRLPFARQYDGVFQLFADTTDDTDLVHFVSPNLMATPDFWDFRRRLQDFSHYFFVSVMDEDIINASKERLERQDEYCFQIPSK